MSFTAFPGPCSGAAIVQTRAPPASPPLFPGIFVAHGYRTTYANFVKCPQ